MNAMHIKKNDMVVVISGDEKGKAGKVLAVLYGLSPGASIFLCTFVMGTIVQEFWRGTVVRMKNAKESVPVALVNLVSRAKRRYGG